MDKPHFWRRAIDIDGGIPKPPPIARVRSAGAIVPQLHGAEVEPAALASGPARSAGVSVYTRLPRLGLWARG